MSLVSFAELMEHAAREKYAVGYFESWNLESLCAVADAATAMHSPVLLGFSGIYLPHPQRRTQEHLQDYAALARSVVMRLPVPACLVFNESPHLDWVNEAIGLHFGLVMYTDDTSNGPSLTHKLQALSAHAHEHHIAVEAEMQALEGVGGELAGMPTDFHFTDAGRAREFVAETRVDALAVNVGQAHMHGRAEVRLDLERLGEIRKAIQVPLVLHGATSVRRDDLRAAVEIGVQKINVGSALKRAYFEALRTACREVGEEYNPYEVVGSGFDSDVLTTARLAMQKQVKEWMQLFGSASQAGNGKKP